LILEITPAPPQYTNRDVKPGSTPAIVLMEPSKIILPSRNETSRVEFTSDGV